MYFDRPSGAQTCEIEYLQTKKSERSMGEGKGRERLEKGKWEVKIWQKLNACFCNKLRLTNEDT